MLINKKILVDGSNPEETRVAILKDGKLQDFDAEITGNHQLKGNVYLGQITRIESSLQAAFVDYGGNRHGFLPFNEVSLDYFNLDSETLNRIMEEEKNRVSEKEFSDKKGHDTTDSTKEGTPQSDNSNFNEDEKEDIQEILKSDEDDITQEISLEKERTIRGERYGYKIHDVLQKDQLILVQVVKEERVSWL